MISAQNKSLEPLLTMGSKYDYAEKRLLLVGTGGIKRRPVMEALRALGLGRITCLHDERNWRKTSWMTGSTVTHFIRGRNSSDGEKTRGEIGRRLHL